MAAPKVVAKGVDEVAFRIRDVANDNDVPIVENPRWHGHFLQQPRLMMRFRKSIIKPLLK